MPNEPLINGQRPEEISESNLKPFPDVHKSDDSLSDSLARYFLGYTSKNLYIYIETFADSIVRRDRAYQNGDGFHLTIGKANEVGSPTDEFYVLGFSPSKDWTRKINWYYNIDLDLRRLGDEVLFETSENNGLISFEALIPWEVVRPWHPMMTDKLAFNLCFVKAVEPDQKKIYFIKTDERMQSEQSKRKYVYLSFEEPYSESQLVSLPERNNIRSGDQITVKITGFSLKGKERVFQFELLDESKEKIREEQFSVFTNAGKIQTSLGLSFGWLPPGNYILQVKEGSDLIEDHSISVFDETGLDRIRQNLSENKSKLREGSYYTIMLGIEEAETQLETLKPYEARASLVTGISEIRHMVENAQKSIDLVNQKRGVYRRGFVSSLDQSIRPYSVYLPDDYDPDKRYPLLVYLHGSGDDDRVLFRTSFIKEGFVVLAPNGRGTSNCFATHEAQTDIKEAIFDVIKNFNVDEKRIILSGFSMGGYGVYRTFYQNPELFSALAIISGHPDLARKWIGLDEINFLDSEKLKAFYKIPMFIYHGEKDMNCPYELTLKFVERVMEHNNNLVFFSDPQAGHGGMNRETEEAYLRWLKNQ